MKPTRSTNRLIGLTILEVVVVLVTLCLLALLLFPLLGTSDKAPRTTCALNLKQVTIGEIIWANDHNFTNSLPGQISTNLGGLGEPLSQGNLSYYYKSLSNELATPRILTCPSDQRTPADNFASLTTNHLSYFLNMDAKSGAETPSLLHGDRYIVFKPPSHSRTVIISTNSSMAWDRNMGHKAIGNIACSDGSVMRTTDRELSEALRTSASLSPQRLLFP